jgi:uncharacterized protein involved in cysteine biosynthesis
VRGAADDRGSGLAWEVKSLSVELSTFSPPPRYFLLAVIPIIGPVLAVLWAGFALAFQFADPPLTRRGLGFGQKRAWHRRYRPGRSGSASRASSLS